jgi:hypothetical protein
MVSDQQNLDDDGWDATQHLEVQPIEHKWYDGAQHSDENRQLSKDTQLYVI